MQHWLNRFQRLNELHQRIESCLNPLGSYIRRGETNPQYQADATKLEGILIQLDSDAWEQLVNKVLPETCNKDKNYGWRQFWNLLNEAYGYALLKSRGCAKIEFIPEPKPTKKGKTEKFADLRGNSPTSLAILDVKTINLSDDEIERNQRRNDPSFHVTEKIGKRIRPGDVKNLPIFVAKLVQQSDPVSAFLWAQFDKPTQEVLAKFVNDAKQAESILVENLNRIVKGQCIYEEKRFANVRDRFQPMTEDILEGHIQLLGFECLNRCLLDDAYPQEISRWSSCVSGVEVFCPNSPTPAMLKKKLEGAVKTAFTQIETTLKRIPQHEKNNKKIERIVLLIVNRDFGCSSVMTKRLEKELRQLDLEVVCQIGDF
jgi:hypothetical protein